MLYNLIEMIITIIGINPGTFQMLSPIISFILDRIARRILTRIWNKITGKKPSPTPTSATHNTPKNLHHPLPETIHTFATDLETKPHFRNYVYTITIWVLSIISLHFQQILDFFLQIANHH